MFPRSPCPLYLDFNTRLPSTDLQNPVHRAGTVVFGEVMAITALHLDDKLGRDIRSPTVARGMSGISTELHLGTGQEM